SARARSSAHRHLALRSRGRRGDPHPAAADALGTVTGISRVRVVVVGSGIAGLGAALVLRRRGDEVLLLERAAEIRAVGSGLLLQPPGLAVLGRLGLLDAALGSRERTARLDRRTRMRRHSI